jgi:hypothetical protein
VGGWHVDDEAADRVEVEAAGWRPAGVKKEGRVEEEEDV